MRALSFKEVKRDKRLAREAAKVEQLAAQKAAEETIKKSEAEIIAKQEADFEAELADRCGNQ